MKSKFDVKSILTLLFAIAVVALTVVLVIHAVRTNDVESLKALVEKFTTATVSALSLALGYFFGRTAKSNDSTLTEGK